MGYKVISSTLYIIAVVSVLYCQEAIYRLNFIIPGIFVIITLHQVLAPKQKRITEDMPSASEFFDKMKSNYDHLKTVKDFISQ